MHTDSFPGNPTLPKGASFRRAKTIGLISVAVLLTAAGVRTYFNVAHAKSVEARTERSAIRSVLITDVKPGQSKRSLTLPATLKGRSEAAIYARINGYVQSWHKDMGDQVKKGDLLAVIDAPELAQELAQALAQQEQIKARLALTQTSLARWEGLRLREAVSQQELDERRAAQQQAQADLLASQANIKRLRQLQAYSRITAPFDGVVVKRQTDVGALVSAGSAGAAKELFYLASNDELRLNVSVSQNYANEVVVGKEVDVKLQERPSKAAKGVISRVSGGIDVATRSVSVEVHLQNEAQQFRPGSYVEVALPLAGSAKVLTVPPNALQFRQDGPRVAVVHQQKLYLKPIKIGRDLGRAVEVLDGLSAGESVVLNPPDTLVEGERVIAQKAPEDKPAAKPGDAKSPAGKKGDKA